MLARVVGWGVVGSTPWSAVRTRRSSGAEALEPAADRRVDLRAAPVEARDVVAVAVELVGLDEVREHQAGVELVDQAPVAASACAFVAPRWATSMPTPANRSRDLADRVDRDAGRLQLVEVRARRAADREVLAARGARERPGAPVNGPRDDAARPRARRS